MKILAWLVVIVLLVFAVVSAGQAGFKWWEFSEAVDEAVLGSPAAAPRPSSWPPVLGSGRVDRVRSTILRKAREMAVPITEDRISVTEEGSELRVRIRWVHPVLTMQDEIVVAIPLTLERTYGSHR
jgi:hypothetical protein